MIDDPFPLTIGRYDVTPGLRALRGPVFHPAEVGGRYHRNKVAALGERVSKYVQFDRFDVKVRETVEAFMMNCLAKFTAESFASIAMFIEEDLAIIRRENGRNWTCALHLCAPNHWAAEDKIGKSFTTIHEPVAEIEPINRRAHHWVDLMINATAGLERTAWGIATDDVLNRHPDGTPDAQRPRRFDAANPNAFLRVERQTMHGFPAVEAALFTIHTTFINCASLPQHRRQLVADAIRSMSPGVLNYKGIAPFRDDLLAWLESPAASD